MQACLQLLHTHLWRSLLTPPWSSLAMARSLSRTLILYRSNSSLHSLLHTLITLGRHTHLQIFQHHQVLHTAALDKHFIRTNPNQWRPHSAARLLVGPVTYLPSLLGRGARTLFRTLPTKDAGRTFWFHSLDFGLVPSIKNLPVYIRFQKLPSKALRRHEDLEFSDLGARVHGGGVLGKWEALY